MNDIDNSGLFGQLVGKGLRGSIPLIIFIGSILLGGLALQFTPREEEPQIVVPMIDILVQAPGLSAKQVARQVTTPLEKLLTQIPGVEHVYSTSSTGQASATLRFHVGQNREESILNTYNKLYANEDKIPAAVSHWILKPIEVDDVPVMIVALWSDDPARYNDFDLRRLGEEVSTWLQAIPQTSEVKLVGGRPRTINITMQPESMAARQTTPLDIVQTLQASNSLSSAQNWTINGESVQLESGDVIRSIQELSDTSVNVVDGVSVTLKEVANITDGPREADHYSWIDFTRAHPTAATQTANGYPMVSISVAKQRSSNAVAVTQDVHQLLSDLRRDILPDNIHIEILRDYGETANDKVNNLASSLAIAIATVVIFIAVFLGWRPALVVGLALPICYGITLALDMAFGYTINRVTLFALILSLGLLVDDPITGIDNISRNLQGDEHGFGQRIINAMTEIRSPLLMSTLTIALAFVPLAFITGMMGPYMAPMAFNVPVSVMVSTLVAFFVTPWLASKLLKPDTGPLTENNTRHKPGLYHRVMSPLLDNPRKSKWLLWGVLGLFIAAAMLPVMRLVPLKLLPFDNKNEVQIVLDMPRSSTLEATAAKAQEISALVRQLPEVTTVAAFVGTTSPIDFNGMVRRYYQRQAQNLADLRITLVDKEQRQHQSHGVVLRLRQLLQPLNHDGVKIKVVEVPPGPPVISTLAIEIYGKASTDYEQQKIAAQALQSRLQREAHVVDVDTSISSHQTLLRFITDKNKAALSGISTDDINQTLVIANAGKVLGYMPSDRDAQPLPIELRLAENKRTNFHDFYALHIKGQAGVVQQADDSGLLQAAQPLVALGELGAFKPSPADQVILHKDLRPVVYVTAELNGRTPAEVVADLNSDQIPASQPPTGHHNINPWQNRNFLNNGAGDTWSVPNDIEVKWTGEGEWRITKDVFRDMGLAFMFALSAIFLVLRLQTASTALSLIIMSAIPLTIIGIMPGFWLLNNFGEREIAGAPEPILFTATAMIGMIALAGIVVRNSLILVEFINQARDRGAPIKEALLQSGSVRLRPILLTAGTTLLGNLVITLDPVFSGLALAIIFGIIASTLFTLIVVPVVYLLVFGDANDTHLSSPKPEPTA